MPTPHPVPTTTTPFAHAIASSAAGLSIKTIICNPDDFNITFTDEVSPEVCSHLYDSISFKLGELDNGDFCFKPTKCGPALFQLFDFATTGFKGAVRSAADIDRIATEGSYIIVDDKNFPYRSDGAEPKVDSQVAALQCLRLMYLGPYPKINDANYKTQRDLLIAAINRDATLTAASSS